MSSAQRHHTMPMEQHPSESLPDEVIPNDAPCLPSSTARQPGAIYDARARGGAPIDRLPWPPAASISYPGPVEQSPAESLPDEAIPNDAPRFPGSSTEGGNVSNGLSTWPSSTQTSSPDVSAASAGWSETGRPRLAPLTTGHSHGHDPSEGELMRSPSSAAPTEIPPPPYERGLSSPAPGAIVRDPASAGSNEFSPPQHAYPGLPPGVSPVSAGGASGQGSQDALIHGALHDASSRGVSGGEPGEAVALPKYSHRPQDGNARLEEQPDGSYKMFPAGQNGLVAMNAIGGSETTSDPEATAGTERTLVQSERGAVVVEEETPTKNPLRKVWRRHFKGPQNRTRRKWLITAIVFVVVFLIILLAVLGAKKKLAGQDDDDSDSDDDDDDDDDDE